MSVYSCECGWSGYQNCPRCGDEVTHNDEKAYIRGGRMARLTIASEALRHIAATDTQEIQVWARKALKNLGMIENIIEAEQEEREA